MDGAGDLAALQEFVIENDELEQLEDMLQEVNLFEAIGATRSEQRHSDFLAFLLDPANSHGLGDLFIKRLLQRSIALSSEDQSSGISPIDLDTWDLNDTLVYRERDNIDILIVNDRLKIAFVIENKVFTKEHSNQLVRYREIIGRQHPDCRVCHFFLSHLGDVPSDAAYIKITYELVVEILDRILETRKASLGSDVQVLIRHYIEMIRRNLVEESKLSELARAIYAKHRHALDLIFEYRPDLQSELSEHIRERITDAGLPLDHCSKSYVRFSLPEWDKIGSLRTTGAGWTNTGRLLLFEFRMREAIQLVLVIGPGDQSVRQQIWDVVQSQKADFKPVSRSLTDKWAQIWSKTVISKSEFASEDFDALAHRFDRIWDSFLSNDLLKLKTAVLTSIPSA